MSKHRSAAQACTLALMCLATLFAISANSHDISRHDMANAANNRFVDTRSNVLRAGVGIGQMACSVFVGSAQRLESADDDGLYFAFLAWRDGFVTATSGNEQLWPLLTDRGEERLRVYCEQHPRERVASVVSKFTLELEDARMTQR